MSDVQPATASPTDATRIAALEAALASSRAQIDELTRERDQLRSSHERLRQDLELLRRRIFVAKAERIDSSQLELEFARKLAALDVLAGKIGDDLVARADAAAGNADGSGGARRDPRKKPSGRRDLSKATIPEIRVEIPDPVFDALVAAGKAELIDWEVSYKLAWQRGGHRRLAIARAKYRVLTPSTSATDAVEPTLIKGHSVTAEPGDDDLAATVVLATAPMPPEAFPRSLAAPSMLAHVIEEKHCRGMPLNRLEDQYAHEARRSIGAPCLAGSRMPVRRRARR